MAFCNCFVFDWQTRQRGGAAHLIWSLLSEMAMPSLTSAHEQLSSLTARLSLLSPVYAPHHAGDFAARRAVAAGERSRLRAIIDAVAAIIYGLDVNDLRHILRDVDRPAADLRTPKMTLDVCGFWRVDRDAAPQHRHTVLTMIAFNALAQDVSMAGCNVGHGVAAFLSRNNSDGWLLPETVRLADSDLGHDDHAKRHQPVASRLGPRFYDWQLAQTTDEGTRERHLHARNLLGELGYARLLRELERSSHQPAEEALPEVAEGRAKYGVGQAKDDQSDILE